MEILGIIGLVLGLAFWLLKRFLTKRATPEEQHRKRYATIDETIAKQDSTAATAGGTLDLDELDRLQHRAKSPDRPR